MTLSITPLNTSVVPLGTIATRSFRIGGCMSLPEEMDMNRSLTVALSSLLFSILLLLWLLLVALLRLASLDIHTSYLLVLAGRA